MGMAPIGEQLGRGIAPATPSEQDNTILDDFKLNSIEKFSYGVMGVLAGAYDEVGQSIGLVDEGDVAEGLKVLSESGSRFYQQREEGFKVAGAIATAFVPILTVPKLIRSGKMLDKALQKTKIGRAVSKAVISSGKDNAARVAEMRKELEVLVDTKSRDITQNPAILKAIRKEQLGSAADMMKENVAIDLTLYAGLNESELFFPSDDSMSNLALYVIPNVAFSVGSGLFTGKAIMKYIAQVDGLAQKITDRINKFGIDSTEVLSAPGLRGVKIADSAATFNAQIDDIVEGSDEFLIANAKGRKLEADSVITDELQKLGLDVIYGKGIDDRFMLSKGSGEIKTAAEALKQEPSLAIGIVSLKQLTPESQIALQNRVDKVLKGYDEEIVALGKKLPTEFGVKATLNNRLKANREFDTLIQKRKDLKESFRDVIETDGSIVPLTEREFSILDTPDLLKSIKSKEGLELNRQLAYEIEMQMGFTNQGAFIQGTTRFVPKKTEDQLIHGINATTVIPRRSLTKETLTNSASGLKNIAVEYTSATPKGVKFLEGLSEDLKVKTTPALKAEGITQELKKDLSQFSPKQIEELQTSFRTSGLHRQLREIADENGLIPLYKTERKGKINADIVEMDIAPTGKFKDYVTPPKDVQTIRRNVHVDDVIGISKGKVIVKGNLKRKNIDSSLRELRVAEKAKSFDAQNFKQRTTAYALAQKFVDDFTPENAIEPLLMHEGRTHLELDVAIAVLKKNPDAEKKLVNFTPNQELTGQELIDRLEFLSLEKKLLEVSKARMAQTAIRRGILKIPESEISNEYKLATMVNLPNPSGVGKSAVMDLAEALTPPIGGQTPLLRSIAKNMEEVRLQIGGMVNPAALGEGRKTLRDFPLSGNSLRFDKDNTMKPVIAMSQNRMANRIGPSELNNLIATQKLDLYTALDAAQDMGAPLVSTIWKALIQDPMMFKLATEVDKLIQGTQAGRGIVSSQRFAARNSEVIQAMDLIQDISGRLALRYIKENTFNGARTLTFGKLASHGNEGSLFSLNQSINQLRNGWDVLEEAIEIGGGRRILALDGKSERNIKMYKQFFGRNLKEDLKKAAEGYIPMPVRASAKADKSLVPTPAVLDELAFEGLDTITKISHEFLQELNFLRGRKGLPPINKRNFHVPYYDVRGASRLHITDLTGKTVHVVSEATEGEAKRVADKAVKDLADEGIQASVQTEDFAQRYIVNAGGQFEAPRANLGFSGRQTGTIKGRSASPQQNIDASMLKSVIEQLQSNMTNIVKYTSSTVFEAEFNFAKSTASALPGSARAKVTETTIWDSYRKIGLQNSPLSEKTALGKTSYAIESAADLFLAKIWDKAQDFIPSTTKASAAEFDKFNEAVGKDYNPFKNFEEFLQRTTKVKTPPSSRAIVAKLNGLATNLILRIADPGMPLINFASVAAVSPAVMRALQRLPKEDFNVWKRRIGIIGSPISESSAIPNTTRMVMSGIHDVFNPNRDLKVAMEEAKRLGFFKQEVAEKIDLLTSPVQGYAKRLLDTGITKASWLTDVSEEFSRRISFAMFYGIGTRSMKLSKEAAFTFAHNNANAIVGDYRSSNKPQIFQGATGMPFGLFTTWAWNFLQRVFGDLEGGRLGAVAVQTGMQAFLFGTGSLPGVAPAIQTLTTSYDGRTNIVDILDDAWGSEAVNIMGSGALANLPKLFGLADGIAIGNRGSISFPNIFDPSSTIEDLAPSIRTVKTLLQGMGQIADTMAQSGFDGRAIAETVSTNAVNGMTKNLAQLGLGYSVDKSGQLINADTRRLPDVIARLTELKTINESNKFKEASRNRMASENRAELSRRLNKQLQTAARGGTLDSISLDKILIDHHNAGGTMSTVKNRVRKAVILGQYEKSERDLVAAYKKNYDERRTARLFELQEDTAE